MLRRWILFWLAASPAGAQVLSYTTTCGTPSSSSINSLVSSGDGSLLYFSSSLKLAGDDSEPAWLKIFRYRQATGRIELAEEITSRVPDQWGFASVFLDYPDLSSDGNALAYTDDPGGTSVFECSSGSSCYMFPGALSDIVVGGVALQLVPPAPPPFGPGIAGTVRLSRNGRYAFTFPCYTGDNVVGSVNALWDLASGTSTHLTSHLDTPIPVSFDSYQSVSDAGLVLNWTELIGPGVEIPLSMSHPPMVERMSGDGQRIVYEWGAIGTEHALVVYNVGSGQETTLTQEPTIPVSPYMPTYQPWISDDGSLVSYIDKPAPGSLPQVFLARAYSPFEITQLTSEPDGIASAMLSGSKNVVYAVTLTNRLICIQTANGDVTEISGPVAAYTGAGVPGSIVTLMGTGDPQLWGSVSVQVGGINVPLLGATTNSATFQIPWEVTPPSSSPPSVPVEITYNGANASQFEDTSSSVLLFATAPAFLGVVHQDFHGPVTAGDPAAPGEILHFYMSGLGTVTPSIATGVVTPTGQLYTVNIPPTCDFGAGEFNSSPTPATLFFAGLAPGLLGTYQLDVQFPANPPREPNGWEFVCGFGPNANLGPSIAVP